MIRAETENVLRFIWSIVRASERPDVGAFCVRAGRSVKPLLADLTTVAVQFLYALRRSGVANDALSRDSAARCSLGNPAPLLPWRRGRVVS